jgi:multiple sugar transport system substrate-binding protein
MTTKSKNPGKGQGVDRRTALKTVAGASALVAGATATGHWKRSYAQSKKVVRVWTTQVAPDQLKSNAFYKKTFEEAHPGIELAWEHVSDNDAWPKLTTAYAGNNPPEVVQHLTVAWNATLWDQGKLVPMNDVVDKVGKADWSPALDTFFKAKGEYFGTPLGGNVFSTMWYRKDLFDQAGVAVPKNFKESVDAFKKLTKDGIYGHPLPYASGGMTDVVGWALINMAGGSTVDENLKTTVGNGTATVDALNYLKEIRPYSPPGATGYSFSESLTAFVSGRTATSWYTGRALMNVYSQNPKIFDQVTGVLWPSKDEKKPWNQGGYHAHWICKGSKNPEEGKLVAAWQYRPDAYIQFLHGAPSHLLPVLKSVENDPKYYDHPILKAKEKEVKAMIKGVEIGGERVKEWPHHQINFKMGEVFGANVFSKMIQRVVINNEDAKTVAAWGHEEVKKIMGA